MPHPKAGYIDAILFLSRANFFLAMPGEPYMTLLPLHPTGLPSQVGEGYLQATNKKSICPLS